MEHRADPLTPSRGRRGLGVPAVVALAVLEVAWLGWFLIEPLPNAANAGGSVRRWIFLARALPQVVPGVRFDQSYLGMALAELGHVENLPQRLPVVLAAALIAGSAVALGRLVIRAIGLQPALSSWERLPLAFGLGTTALGLVTLLLGRAGVLAPWPIRGLLVVPIVVEAIVGHRWRGGSGTHDESLLVPRTPRPPALAAVLGFALIAGPFLLITALAAMLPTIDFDAIEYHLQGPKEYFQAGRIAFLPHNVYTSMPFSVEMLHLLGMEVLGDWWWGALAGQLLVASYAAASAAMIALVAGRLGAPRAAWVAAVVYLTTPWVYRLGALPYVEGPLCFYHAALVWALARAWTVADGRTATRLWGVAGLLAGGAMACKYPALLSAVVPSGMLALTASARRRSWPILLAFVAGWAVVMTPWLARNVVDTGNPVYPLAYRVFGGRHWDAAQDAKWSRAHGPRPASLAALGSSLVDVAGRSDWQSPLYAALAPLALVRVGSRRAAWALWGVVAYLFLTWWLFTHRLDRFWLPLLPPLAVLAGLGADVVRGWLGTTLLSVLLGVSILTNLAYDSTALAGLNEWTADLGDLRTRVPEMLNPPLARLDATLPQGSKVLLVGQAAVFHFRHPIVYNTVFNRETFETLARGRSSGEVRRALREARVTHVYVDWLEVERYRKPGNYGFTPFVTPEVFARLVAAGVLAPLESPGARQDLYRLR